MKSISQLEEEISYLQNELKFYRNVTSTERSKYHSDIVEYPNYSMKQGYWECDLITKAVFLSPEWYEMLGYKEGDFPADEQSWFNLMHPEDRAIFPKNVNEFLNESKKYLPPDVRIKHKKGHYLFVVPIGLQIIKDINNNPVRISGSHLDITSKKNGELFERKYNEILRMIAQGVPASKIYNEIATIYEGRHEGIRCSMLELDGNILRHGCAPSLPKEYSEQVDGLVNGPNVGSCGASSYTGKRVVVENIETDPKWENLKQVALPYGMRSCWSEPIKSSEGEILGAFGMYRDYPCVPTEFESLDLTAAARLTSIVMERDRNQKKIKMLAYYDELTGLSSRAHLFINIKKLIKVSKRYHERFSLLYIDLDNFKNVNDTLGHDVGDYLLQKIALRIIDISRDADCISRLGGDEFCILVKERGDSDSASIVAQRTIDVVSKQIELSGRKFNPSCSVGIARYPNDGTSLESLLKAADIALYTAKDIGKGSFAFYNDELSRVAEYHFRVEQYLREAIEKKQLKLVYQPQIDIASGEISGVEALSRWEHPELGHVSPIEFIAVAERIGMIKPLTEWVIHDACVQGVKWRKAGFPDLKVCVNISPSHLCDADFITFLKSELASTGMYSHCLELEITESVVQTNHKDFSIFESLKELGVLLAIDDFGTGYSSFASLKYLKVDYIKIDKYFINDLLTDNKTKLLVGSMIEMGHNLGYKVIAEGVEIQEQFNELKRLGSDISQGYLFSRPVNPEQVSVLLSNNSEALNSVT